MDKALTIASHLTAQKLPTVGEIVENPNKSGQFLVFIEVIRDFENKQVPSNSFLKRISENLSSQEIDIDFILVDKSGNDLEAGAKASLMHSFGDFVRNAFISLSGTSASIWIEAKREISPEERKSVKDKMDLYFGSFDISFSGIFLTNGEKTPSKIACLKNLRTISPAKIPDLSAYLEKRGFTVPSDTWLTHKMDPLRKASLVIRQKNGTYTLTHQALSLLGTTRSARSPDITRLLDLARRGR